MSSLANLPRLDIGRPPTPIAFCTQSQKSRALRAVAPSLRSEAYSRGLWLDPPHRESKRDSRAGERPALSNDLPRLFLRITIVPFDRRRKARPTFSFIRGSWRGPISTVDMFNSEHSIGAVVPSKGNGLRAERLLLREEPP